ncbi:MAG: hypothetical protein RR851_10300 [Clostridium sp.]
MEVRVLSLTEESQEERDYRDILVIEVDGKKVFEVMDGESEDSNLSRDFNDCFNVPKLMEMAYEAGKKGEDFKVKHEEVEEI